MATRSRPNGAHAWLTLVMTCSYGLGCHIKPPVPPPEPVEIALDPESQRLSIEVRDVPRMSVLSALKTATGIEVRPTDVANDSVTVAVKNAPITKAVEQLLPVGARYILRPGAKDITIESEGISRKVGTLGDRTHLPSKGQAPRPPRPHLGAAKPHPDRWRPPRVQARGNMKSSPRRSLRVPPGRLPKIAAAAPPQGHALGLSFRVRSNGALQVQWARVAEGTPVATSIVRGPFIYVLRNNAGEAVAFGTVSDPFATRTYSHNAGRHDTGSADVGVFGVWLPVTLDDSGQLDSSSTALLNSALFELYDGRGRRLPRRLTKKELENTLRRVQLVSRVRGSVLLAAKSAGSTPSGDEPTVLLRSGPDPEKFNLVILGDGFDATEQDEYNELVYSRIVEGVFNEIDGGVYREIMNGFNIFRVNKESTESGIPKVDAAGDITQGVRTYFDFRYSDASSGCFAQPGLNTSDRINTTLQNLGLVNAYVFVILNVDGSPACAHGTRIVMARSRPWQTAAHELGHVVGDLGDEYPGTGAYSCSDDPAEFNLAKITDRQSLRWGEFVHAENPLPPGGSSLSGYVGAFKGGIAWCDADQGRRGSGLYRPTSHCRMIAKDTTEFCDVCYDQMQRAVEGERDHGFSKTYVGQFDTADGGDVVVHTANSLALYSGAVDKLDVTWVRTLPDPVWGDYQSGDEFHVGDFNADGIDDLFVFNSTDGQMPYLGMLQGTGAGFKGVRKFDGVLPGWGDMRGDDKLYVADFDGDDRDDILVLNTTDWDAGYLVMLRSTGQDLEFVHRYDKDLPGWFEIRENDHLYVGSFDTVQGDDLYIFNGSDWPSGQLGMLQSTGSGYSMVERYDGMLPGGNDLATDDQFYVADFDGDSKDDLYVFNGDNWQTIQLQMLRSVGTGLEGIRFYDGSVPGSGAMWSDDLWYVADFDGDGREDLYVFNATNGPTRYLGMFRSSGTDLFGSWDVDTIGAWDLDRIDRLKVVDLNGGLASDDLVIYNDESLGLLRSGTGGMSMSAMYPGWVHDHTYHKKGWW